MGGTAGREGHTAGRGHAHGGKDPIVLAVIYGLARVADEAAAEQKPECE